jgi:NTE family protein
MNELMNKIRYILIILSCLIIESSFAQTDADSNFTLLDLPLRNKYNLDTNSFNIFPKKYNRKKVALVLSGGGARGFAQLGILKSFEKNNIDFDFIVGTSIGSVIGGLYSAGYTTSEIDSLSRNADWKKLVTISNKYSREYLFPEQKRTQDMNLITLSLDGFVPTFPTSLTTGQQITEFLNELFLNARINNTDNFINLKKPFFPVATDLKKGERVVFSKGNLTECIKASFTFPLIYSPTRIKDMDLIDGGLTANIPVDVAKEKGADYIITVNSTSPLKTEEELKDNPINTADQILSISMAQLNKYQLEKSDFTLTPNVGNQKAEDFMNLGNLIRAGELCADSSVSVLKYILDSLESSSSEQYNNFLTNPSVIFESEYIPDSLKSAITNEQNLKFVKYIQIERSMRSIYDLGYFKNVYAKIYRKDGYLFLKYFTEANPILRDINYASVSKEADKVILKFITINTGEAINLNKTERLYFEILGALRSEKLSSVDITKFYYDYETGNLEIRFSGGIIDTIRISGNKRISPGLILREVSINSHKRAEFDNIRFSLKSISGTNLFNQVSLYRTTDSITGKNAMNINIVEKSTRLLSFAVRVDNERNLQLLGDIRDRNIFGTGAEFGLTASGGLRSREYKFELHSNRLFKTFYTFSLSGYYNFLDYFSYIEYISTDNLTFDRIKSGEFRDIRYGMKLLAGTQIEKFGTIYGQLTLENIRVKDIDRTNYSSETRVLKFRFGGRLDTRDKYPFPDYGIDMNYFYETAQNHLRGNETYSKLFASFAYNFNLFQFLNLKPKVCMGFSDLTTPIPEQYNMGGEDSFMGMLENQLRGRQVLISSLEFRYSFPYKLFFDTYLAFRYDVGRIWEKSEDIRFKDLRHGLGLSALFDTPIGKASFSVGRTFIVNKGFTSNSFIWGPYTFYFSLGYDI